MYWALLVAAPKDHGDIPGLYVELAIYSFYLKNVVIIRNNDFISDTGVFWLIKEFVAKKSKVTATLNLTN